MPRSPATPADLTPLLTALAGRWDGDVAALLAAAERGRHADAPVRPTTVTEVIALLDAGVVDKTEARGLLGLKPTRRAVALRRIAQTRTAKQRGA